MDTASINRPHTPPDDTPIKNYRATNPAETLEPTGEAFPNDFPSKLRTSTNTGANSNLTSSTDLPAVHLTTRLHRLVHWNDPLASSLALFGSLGMLLLTSYVSFFRLFCSTATILIGANLVYVNLMIQGQKIFAGTEGVNPHSRYIGAGLLISRERVENVINYSVQLLNDIMQEATKVVLIEDNARSIRYLLAFYLGWTLATYIPTNWLIGTGLVLGFTGPMLYTRNKDVIDERVGHWHRTARTKLNDAATTTQYHAQSLYDSARSFANKHGIPSAASKVGATFKTDVPLAKKEE